MANLLSLDQPRIVVFVDIGHSKTTITVARFTKEEKVKAEIVLHRSDKNLGGRDFDWLALLYFAK